MGEDDLAGEAEADAGALRLVVKKGRKTSCRSPSGTPGPLSATSIRARPARGADEGEPDVRRVAHGARAASAALRSRLISTWLIRSGSASSVGIGRRPTSVEADALGAVAGAEQALQLLGPGGDVDRPAADFRRAADLAVAFDEMHHPVGAAGERLDRRAGVGDIGIRRRGRRSRIRSAALWARLVTGVIEFMISWVRTRIRSRLGGDLDRVQLALDRLHRDHPDQPAEPVHDRGADQHRLRHAVGEQRAPAGAG